MKQCTKCKTIKLLDEFGKHPGGRDGRKSWCKTCHSNHQQEKLARDPKFREYKREYRRVKYQSDPDYRVACTMRLMVHRVLRTAGTIKPSASKKLLGYSVKELRCHIENQFIQGMSWETHGAWHIDHIKPVSAFIAEGITDPKIINALSNLRPLWARDNLVKGAK